MAYQQDYIKVHNSLGEPAQASRSFDIGELPPQILLTPGNYPDYAIATDGTTIMLSVYPDPTAPSHFVAMEDTCIQITNTSTDNSLVVSYSDENHAVRRSKTIPVGGSVSFKGFISLLFNPANAEVYYLPFVGGIETFPFGRVSGYTKDCFDPR